MTLLPQHEAHALSPQFAQISGITTHKSDRVLGHGYERDEVEVAMSLVPLSVLHLLACNPSVLSLVLLLFRSLVPLPRGSHFPSMNPLSSFLHPPPPLLSPLLSQPPPFEAHVQFLAAQPKRSLIPLSSLYIT